MTSSNAASSRRTNTSTVHHLRRPTARGPIRSNLAPRRGHSHSERVMRAAMTSRRARNNALRGDCSARTARIQRFHFMLYSHRYYT